MTNEDQPLESRVVRRVSLSILPLAVSLCLGLAPVHAAKRAVVVGVNSYAKNPLRGCIRDSSKMTTVTRDGFDFEDVTVLNDGQASRAGILGALGGVASRSQSGDLVVFYFSGHGALFPDDYSLYRDESIVLPANPALGYSEGRYDSAICPVDFARQSAGSKAWRNLILDDELFVAFSHITRRGALVFVISDSCHSGTLTRDLAPVERPKYMPIPEILPSLGSGAPRALDGPPSGDRGLDGLYLSVTGSRDNQASLDTPSGGLFTGAFIDALVSSGGDITGLDLYETVRSAVLTRTRGRQEPQLDTRFFRGSLDFPVFSVPDATTAQPTPETPSRDLRLVVRVRDEAGQPLPDAVFCVVKPGRAPSPGAITAEDALVLGKTDARGLKDAGRIANLASGNYWVKVLGDGYKPFWESVPLKEGSIRGTAVLSFRLAREN